MAGGASRVVLLDSTEHNLVQIQQQLGTGFDHVPREFILGSVTDEDLLDEIFTRFQPEIIYHAAAFKHVPLLEHNPVAGVRNNALGTYALARSARRHGVSRLILISTDKAVNPRSVMGVSKRLAELAVVALSGAACRMNAIRLGNVIGSTGSVVPIFLSQIAERRPVTVTHPEATRWFMSLGQAVDAILACGTAEVEGRILVPELGEQTRITDLAALLIGDADVPIVFTGCRPGDKLSEELVYQSEIREGIVEGPLQVLRTCRMEGGRIGELMQQLCECVAARDVPGLMGLLCAAVPEYVPSDGLRFRP